MISVLGNILPLENGGYLLGNYCINKTIGHLFKEHQFHTICTFSPYIADQATLQGFNEYVYTTKFNITPLINYRFKYFNQLAKSRNLTETDITACQFLLDDALTTWYIQLEELRQHYPTTHLITPPPQLDYIITAIKKEIDSYKRNTKHYTLNFIRDLNRHILFHLSNEYNRNTNHHDLHPFCKDWNELLHEIQKQQIRIDHILKNSYSLYKNADYIIKTTKINGFKTGFRLCKRIFEYPQKNLLLNSIQAHKEKVSLRTQLNYFASLLTKNNTTDIFAYIHADDFHLPSIFYTPFDQHQEHELKSAIELLKKLIMDILETQLQT